MKVTMEKPVIFRYIYRQETGDSNYGSCIWAIFDIDPGRGMLNIQSDCGNYAYRWPERGTMFLNLLAGMDEDYLLRKLCGKPGEFDEEGTIARIEEYMNDMEMDVLDIEEAIRALKDTFSNYTLDDAPDIAEFLVDEWNNDCNLEIDCAWELVQTKYGAHEKRIVKIFTEHIAPKIRQAMEDGFYHEEEN